MMDGNAKSRISDALYYLNQIDTLFDDSPLAAAVRKSRRELRAAMESSLGATLSADASDSLIKLLRDMEAKARIAPHGLSDEYAKRLKRLVGTDGGAVSGRTPEAKPEVIQGSDVADLPEGSYVVACLSDGELVDATSVRRVGNHGSYSSSYYRVLDRAPEKPVKVGDKITGTRAMTLPTGAIVLRNGWPRTKVGNTYRSGPGDNERSVVDGDSDLTVLYLPEEN